MKVPGAAIRFARVGAELRARWDEFVRGHPEGSPYHLSAWQRAVEATTNSEDRSIVALRGESVVGGVPLGLVRSRLFGTSVVSAPFATGGGILARSAEVHAGLREECAVLMRETSASCVALRYQSDTDVDLPGSDLYCGFRRPLPENPDDCLPMLPRKARAAARKGLGFGLKRRVPSIEEGVARLHELFRATQRRLGTPVLPRALFEAISEEEGLRPEVLLIEHEGRVVAGVMSFHFGEAVLPYYSGYRELARSMQIGNVLYLELMRHEAAKGTRHFDFGRSRRGTGAFRFKTHQGFEPVPMPYRFILPEGGAAPSLNPSSDSLRLPIAIWKRLPAPVADLLGPMISRGLP